MGETVAEPLEKQIRDLSVAQDKRGDELAKKLGVQVLQPDEADLEKVRLILARGEPLSRIVREQRERNPETAGEARIGRWGRDGDRTKA